ncbi:hydrolase [Lacticaseibacillus camelliae]|uniref:Cell wall-associated hydrolase n=1 Tax=Lacticaseibacillus camelliae DSM 22697 = JCM 13995 TaxID=1423730 RepID=A0A0R2FLU0_9LACO|nr:hydrolase [Lacticaseibacillus camelliae]KRN25834.1 hypothetical protein FC75_GL002189 [Lacticaseibacillus camelliae DSM 22697 = JCM 13995]
MSFIKIKHSSIIGVGAITTLAAAFAIYTSTQPVEAISTDDAANRQAQAAGVTPAAEQTAAKIVATNKLIAAPAAVSPIKPGDNTEFDAMMKQRAEAAAKAKAQAAAKAKADAKAKAQAAAKAKAEAKAAQVAKAASTPAARAAAPTTSSATGTSKGTFRVTFYDPAAMGSSMGYGGIAANLGVLPRGSRVKIQLSNGQTLIRVVNDTGGFAAGNPHQIDVAMPNSQIPSAGVLSAIVTII